MLFERRRLHATLIVKYITIADHGKFHVFEGIAFGQYHGTSAIAKQYTTVTLVPVAVFRGLFSTHNQYILEYTDCVC